MSSQKISASEVGGPQPFLSAVFFADKWLVGGDNGKIYVILKASKSISKDIMLTHEGAATGGAKVPKGSKPSGPGITALNVNRSSNLLLSGGKNGSVVVWNSELQKVHSFQVADIVSESSISPLIARQIQSIHCATREDESLVILCGTRGCDVLEIACEKNSDGTYESCVLLSSNGGVDIRGHCNDELWGIACHPTKPEFVTVGDDKTLRKWSVGDRKMIKSASIGVMARAVAYDPTGNFIAVGFGGRVGTGKQKQDGLVRVYNDCNFSMLFEAADAKQWISDIKFSPDGLSLAVGSHNRSIYLYSVSSSGSGQQATISLRLRTKFSKHNSYITHFDFSSDSR